MFRQIKSIAQNFTNHQHAAPHLLLNVQRRLECNRYYHGNNFETRSSEFPFLLQRLSTFLVINNGDRYGSTVQKQLLVFSYKSCSCASSDRLVCLGKKLPAFEINNIMYSTISKILKV